MSLRDDENGLESLPLKLMIVAIVASLSIIPASHALQGLENRDFARRANLELDLITWTAQLLTTEGPGSVRTISLDFRGDGALRPDHLTIGDSPGGANISSAILRLTNGASIISSATDPPVVMHGPVYGPFVTNKFVINLRMSALMDNRTLYILVEES